MANMEQREWKKVAESSQLQDGIPTAVEISEEESVLLLRRGESLLAWGNECPHVGCPLGYGAFDGAVLTCPCHNARFDLTSGAMISPPALDDLSSYPVKEEGGSIYVGDRISPTIEMPAGSDTRSVIIVGGGAAGSAAAEQLRREGFSGEIVLVSKEQNLPYDRTLLSKMFLSSDMSVEDLYLRSKEFYERLEISLRLGTTVSTVDPEAREVTFDDGSGLAADMILLATGAGPVLPSIPGAELSGVCTLRTPEDALEIRKHAKKGSRAVIVGASFIGTEVAAYLRNRGMEVTIVAPEQLPFERVLGGQVGNRFKALHESQGVVFELGKGVADLKGTDEVESVHLSDGTELPAALVVLGVGVSPVMDYLDGSGLVEEGAVPVNHALETKYSGVYAAGDIARIELPKGAVRAEHWVVAQRHGQHVAKCMVHGPRTYEYQPFFWTMQFETPFVYIGHAPNYDETWVIGNVEGGDFLVGYATGGRLEAVATIGMSSQAISLGKRLEAGEEIKEATFRE